MALNPVAFFSPGCSPQCRPCVAAKSDSFAFAGVQSISLHRVTTATVVVPKAASSDPSQQSQQLDSVTVTDYPLSTLFGHGIHAAVTAFAYNDEYMACLTAQNRQVVLWRLKDAEPLSAKKNWTTALSSAFAHEGMPSAMCLAGKHHILCGTKTGRLISLNTGVDNAEPRTVAIPPSARSRAATSSTPHQQQQPHSPLTPGASFQATAMNADASDSPPEAVECLLAATARPEIVACGTADGTLCLLNLNASTGLRITASLCPFPPKEKEKGEVAVEMCPLPVTSLAFEPTTAQYLAVASQDGALALCDINSNSIVQVFEVAKLPEKRISSITWIPGESGALYTATSDSTVLRKWNISSKTSVGSVSVMKAARTGCGANSDGLDTVEQGGANAHPLLLSPSVGIRSIACIDQARFVVGLTDGGVKVYNAAQQQLECELRTGHTDATLSCRLSKHDCNVAASGGADGVLRLWNLRTLSQQASIPVGPVMVHAVDWSPNGKYLVVGLGSGEVVVYTTATSRVSWRVPTFPDLVYNVCWAVGDSSLIVATSRSGVVALSSRDGKVLRRYPAVRGAFYGADVEPVKGKMMAVGCHDHHVFIYNLSSSAVQPTLILTGHSDAVCDVAYNPAAPQYLLSGSYDGTLRVWDLSSNDAHTISVSSRVLKGHSDRVRSVAWCSLAPYLALSGSADASVRLWDIRNGVAITTVRGHNADVIALTSHSDRPLLFLSAARDGTMVAWNVALLRQVYLDAALGTLANSVVADPSSLMGVATTNVTVSQVSGSGVQRLVKELAECAARPAERLQKLLSFFECPNGAAEVARMVLYVLDPAAYKASTADGKPGNVGLVIPAQSLPEVARARASYVNERAHSKTVNAAGPSYKKQRLLEAAEELLLVGNIEAYCNTLIEAEEWDRAIAASPAISRAYWRSVCLKAAEAMEMAGDARAVRYYIIGEQAHKAAQVLSRISHGLYDAAMTVCQACPQQVDSSPQQQLLQQQQVGEPSHNTTVDVNGVTAVTQQFQQLRTAVLLKQYANPQLVAAVLLMSGLNDEAVKVLQHCGDVVLSHLLVHTVPLREQTSIDMAYRLSMLQSARQHKWDTALLCATRQSNPYDSLATILALFQTAQSKQLAGKATAQSLTSGNLATFQGVSERLKAFYEQVRGECAKLQLTLDAAAVQQRHANDGLASQNQLAAMVLGADPSTGPTTGSAVLTSLCGFMESLLNVVLQDVDGANTPFYLRQAYSVSAYVSIPVEASGKSAGSGSPSASTIGASMAVEHKHFLALVFMVASLMAVKVYRFPKLLNFAFTKARELATTSGSQSLSSMVSTIQGALGAYSPHSKEVDCSAAGGTIPGLSGDGRQITSILSGDPVYGAVHVMEDGTSFISRSEALAWMMCAHFSPLATGARLIAL